MGRILFHVSRPSQAHSGEVARSGEFGAACPSLRGIPQFSSKDRHCRFNNDMLSIIWSSSSAPEKNGRLHAVRMVTGANVPVRGVLSSELPPDRRWTGRLGVPTASAATPGREPDPPPGGRPGPRLKIHAVRRSTRTAAWRNAADVDRGRQCMAAPGAPCACATQSAGDAWPNAWRERRGFAEMSGHVGAAVARHRAT